MVLILLSDSLFVLKFWLLCFHSAFILYVIALIKKKERRKTGRAIKITEIAITFDIMPTWLIEYYKRFDNFEMNKMNSETFLER